MRFVLLFVLLIVIAIGCVDAAGRLLLRGTTKFDFVESTTSNSRVLFVFLPGILAGGVGQSTEILPMLKQHGDVLLVSYDGNRFIGENISRDVAAELLRRNDAKKYDRVVLLGVSLGGLVAYDTFVRLDRRMTGMPISLVQMDAPTTRTDLQSPLDKITLFMKAWYQGPLSNMLRAPVMNAMFDPPKEENIEAGVDESTLEMRVQEAKSFPLSIWGDQIRYIIGHKPVVPGSLKGVSVIVVRSTRDDDTVRPYVFSHWNSAASGKAIYIEVDSTHVGFNERPATWREAFETKIIPALSLN